MIDLLKGINVPKSVMGFGGFLCLLALVNEGLIGFSIVDGTNIYAASVGAVLIIVGYLGYLLRSYLDAKLKIADAGLREEKIKHGLDPEKDKTIIRPS